MQSSFTAGIGPLSAGSSSLLWHFSSACSGIRCPLCILLPILSFRKKDTPYGFAQYQADEFEVRHGIASLFRKN